MVFHEVLLSTFSSPGILTIVGSVFGILFLVFLIWLAFRNSGITTGRYEERRRIKGLGSIILGAGGFTGRGLYSILKGGVKGSIKLGKMFKAVGNSKFAKDTSNYFKRLIKGEERNIEGQLHQTATAAASLDLANVIGKLANSELNEHAAIEKTEKRIDQLGTELQSLSSLERIDEASIRFVSEIGKQITSSLVQLAHDENLELNTRKRAFDEVYRILKVIKSAETLAKRIEKRNISNEKQLINYIEKEISDLFKILKETLKKENQKIKDARAAYNSYC